MKTMTKIFLMIALLGSTAMADGDMGNGVQGCTVNCPPPPPPCESNCLFAGQPSVDPMIESADVIIDFVKEYVILGFSI